VSDSPRLHKVFPYRFDREAEPVFRSDKSRQCPNCGKSMSFCWERHGEVNGVAHMVLAYHCDFSCSGALFEEISPDDGWFVSYLRQSATQPQEVQP